MLLLLFMFWFLGHEACDILAPQQGIEASPSALKSKVLTTGLPAESQAVQSYQTTICVVFHHLHFTSGK